MNYFFNIINKPLLNNEGNMIDINKLQIKLIFEEEIINYNYLLGDIIHSYFFFEEEEEMSEYIAKKIKRYLKNNIVGDIEDIEDADSFYNDDFERYHLLLEAYYHLDEIISDVEEFIYCFHEVFEDEIDFVRDNLEDYEDMIIGIIIESEEDSIETFI